MNSIPKKAAVVAMMCTAVGGYFFFKGMEPSDAWTAYAPQSADGIRVLIFADKPEEIGEEMDDWAYYLNDFASSDEHVSVTFEAASLCNELIVHEGCVEPYSTLFLNNAGEAYFYEGHIVEPQVYHHAKAALRSEELTPELKAFASESVSLR